ncbi:hypothetical protein TWF281_011682 [Arthrobotrys megalospora]
MSSSSTEASQGEVAQQAAPSTPGPIRRQPQNTLIKYATSPYTTKQAIQNNSWFPTLHGLLRGGTGPIAALASVAGGVQRAVTGNRLFAYISKSTKDYLGLNPPPPSRTALTDGSLHEKENQRSRENAAVYYDKQDREKAEEAKRVADRAAEIRELGDSLKKVSPQVPEVSNSWTEELAKTGPAYAAGARKAKRTNSAKNQKPASKAAGERIHPYRQTPKRSGFKDEFQENFKSDASKDPERLAFLFSYTSWKPSFFRNQASVFQRFPKLREDFDFSGEVDHTDDIRRLADILSDRGFLKRQGIVTEITFEPVWGRKPVGDAAIAALPKVYIPEDQIEPSPSYKIRAFSEEEREHMTKNADFAPLRREFRKQTIYDLTFHTPADSPLTAAEIELSGEEFEVSRDDPRFRQLWTLLPSIRVPGNRRLLEANAKSRLVYKRLVSRRDYWFWKVIQEVQKRDRYLAKVYTHFDLNRKRSEMNWDEFRRVQIVRTNNPPPQVEEAIAQEPVKSGLSRPADAPADAPTNAPTNAPANTLPKSRENRATSKGKGKPRRNKPYKSYTRNSYKCWINEEMDLSDEDNFPSRRPGHHGEYDGPRAEYQARRLAKAVGSSQEDVDNDRLPKPKSQQPKRVTFAPGHTLRIFEQEESDASRSASPADAHTSKKMKSTGERPVLTAQTSAGPGPRKPAVPVQTVSSDGKTSNPKVPQAFTKPATVGKGSSDPMYASYQKSLIDVPREWRRREDAGTFSAWEEDTEEAGIFYEMDIIDGKLPKGRGSWETELDQTRGPKRVRIMRSNGSQQDFAVWSQDGTLHDLDWVPADQPTQEDEEQAALEAEVAEFKRLYPNLPTPEVEALPDLRTAFRDGYHSPKNDAERIRMWRIMAATKDRVKAPRFRAATDEEAANWGPGSTLEETRSMYQRQLEMDQREAALKKEKEELLKLKAELDKAQEQPNMTKKRRRSTDNSPAKSPSKATEITGDFPRFNPFEALPDETQSPTKSSRSGALPSPPLSNEDENSGKEDTQNTPGSKAKARLTGLFDPVQTQKGSGFTVVEDSKVPGKLASFGSEITAPPSQGSGDMTTDTNDVFRPIVNGATLPRLGSTGEIPKVQSLLPSAPITAAPATPSAITPAEAGMFASVKPSLKNEMSLDEGSSMEIDNTPQSAKKIRSPKEFGFVTNAATTMAETFKPTVPASFDFGSMTSKPAFGIDDGKSFALGGPTSNPFAGNNNAFQFGATTAAPSIFGVSTTTDKPSDGLFVFGGNNKPVAKTADEPFLFGGNKAASKATDEPFLFGGNKPAEKPADLFNFGGPSTTPAAAPPINFGVAKPAEKDLFSFGSKATGAAPTTGIFGPTSVPTLAEAVTAATSNKITFGPSTTAPSIFGTSTAAPSAPSLFGATSNASTTNGLFGAASGASAAPSFTAAPTSFNFGDATSAPAFGANNTATSSASFTFGSTATTQPVQFGSELPKPTSTSFNSTFNFGNKSEAPNSFFGASNAAPSPAPTGTAAPIFGASNPGTPNAGASFGGDAGTNMFGFQPPTTNAHGRTIKAPVSRKAGSVRGRR